MSIFSFCNGKFLFTQLHNSKPISSEHQPSFAVNSKLRFDALTSLRFFAATMIVVLHSSYSFFGYTLFSKFALGQGVSFFYVLSGFILSCVHPTLTGSDSIPHYLLLRVGRIWPSHVITALAAFLLVPEFSLSIPIVILNLLLLQAWMPDSHYYFSLNAVAWSLSCEIFFYACFIGLIKNWKFDLTAKLCLVATIFIGACILANAFSQNSGHLEFDKQYILYINPIIRLIEFITGMLTAKIWLRFGSKIRLNTLIASSIELMTVILIIAEVVWAGSLQKIFEHFPSASYWLGNSGATPLFAALVLIAALQQGFITKALANPVLIWLGEISYSLYLVHWLLMKFFNIFIPEFIRLNCWAAYLVYWLAAILLSQVNYNLIEDPFRRIVRIFTSPISEKLHFSALVNIFSKNIWRVLKAIVLLAIVIGAVSIYLNIEQRRFNFVSLNIEPTQFGDNLILEKAAIAKAKDGLKLKLTWRSTANQVLRRTINVQALDSNKIWCSEFDKDDIGLRQVSRGQEWSDTLYMPAAKNFSKWQDLGLRVCIHKNPYNSFYLSAYSKKADFWNTRLIIPINENVY